MSLSHFRVAIVVLALMIANNALAQTNTAKATEKNDSVSKTLVLQKTIYGQISPKSIVHSGDGLFFAQNMMYNHTVTVYDRNYKLLKTIKDEVNLADYGFDDYNNTYKGAPVEVAFSHGGQCLGIELLDERQGL